MAEGKKSFTAYCDWKETFESLPDDKAGQLIKHIFQYVNDENPETDDLLIKAVFAQIKATLKRDLKKWEQKREKNRENARLRWDKQNANASDRINRNANNAVSDSVSVSVSDIDNKYLLFGDLFFKSLKSNNLIIKNQKTNKAWYNEIRKLEQVDGVKWEDIKAGANYYFANIGKQYLPEIRSTKAFREKFEKLVSHKQRNK
jgi:hypothetical protein